MCFVQFSLTIPNISWYQMVFYIYDYIKYPTLNKGRSFDIIYIINFWPYRHILKLWDLLVQNE